MQNFSDYERQVTIIEQLNEDITQPVRARMRLNLMPMSQQMARKRVAVPQQFKCLSPTVNYTDLVTIK